MSSGREDDDYRLVTDTEEGKGVVLNNLGAYPTCCVELTLDGLSVNTVLQSQVGVASRDHMTSCDSHVILS